MSSPQPDQTQLPSAAGGSSYSLLLKLAWPLILSNSFTTIQLTVDRYFLTKYDPDAVSAAMSSLMLFWIPFVMMFSTVMYIATFVAQYIGAGRPHRVGPAIWQSLYFSLFCGLLCMAMIPFANRIVGIADHGERLRGLEAEYFRCLCWMGLPSLIVAAASAFFSGRGESRTVLWINGVGMVVNALLCPIMIFGRYGCPELGITGASWATVIANWAAAIVGLALMFRRRYRLEFNLIGGWRFEWSLFRRFMWYGLPSGLQWLIDTLAFTSFLLMAEWFSAESLAATSLAFSINQLIFIPLIGMGQAVSILVGQRLGDNRPEEAESFTWKGMAISFGYMAAFGVAFVAIPEVFVNFFESEGNPERWARVAEQLKTLLYFVAFYSLFDSAVVVLSFALKGAGDTRYVTLVAVALSWPIMVIPTRLAWSWDWSFYWSWGFASTYIAAQAICFLVRFRGGKWKSMRVIEAVPIE